jgi:hypothetical protein
MAFKFRHRSAMIRKRIGRCADGKPEEKKKEKERPRATDRRPGAEGPRPVARWKAVFIKSATI